MGLIILLSLLVLVALLGLLVLLGLAGIIADPHATEETAKGTNEQVLRLLALLSLAVLLSLSILLGLGVHIADVAGRGSEDAASKVGQEGSGGSKPHFGSSDMVCCENVLS